MKIKQDLLRITNALKTDAGDKAEPEQQTVQRVMLTDASAATTDGRTKGTMQAAVLVESQVSDFARAVRSCCANCAHFDNAAFVTFFRKADHPTAPMHLREGVNAIRAALLQTMNASLQAMHNGMDGDMDVEHALQSLGFCRALGEVLKEETIVHPLSTCPPESITPSTPNGYFKPRDRTSEKAGERAYDNILKRAAGKEP